VEVWYLFGAWVLAAAMNATLTWWGVSVAIASHTPLGSAVVSQETLLKGVPIFIAVLVWVIRLLLIGTFSIAGERIFSMADDVYQPAKRYDNYAPNNPRTPMTRPSPTPSGSYAAQRPQTYAEDSAITGLPFRPSPKPEPSYHPLGASSANSNDNRAIRR
jgi:hypothetical protein